MDLTTTRRGVAFTPMETRPDVLVRAAALADDLGYESFSVAEGWGLDSAVLLAALAGATRRITLIAGVLSVWGRTPATIAMTAATLHRLSGGRFVLGLGASTRRLVEGFHDVRYERPAVHLHEVTARVRALLRGERIPGGLRLGQPPAPEVPIWLAATGPRTLRTAAELADGWYPLYLRRDRIGDLAGRIARHRIRSLTDGLPQRPITVAAGPFTVVDPDAAAARTVATACTAAYLTTMGEVYPRLVAGQGLAEDVERVRAGGEVSERLLDEFTAYGEEKTVRDQLERWDATVDVTMLGIPPGLPWPMIEATIRAGRP
ncbi:LLM class flavin-dependent oxidoreductase [Actinoplanes rectilineatus]|uniref:LLM class flavin-dependent oxidoreductase n=1 Tax=Actinoplanes rectilineatus TaxID=113571 RepID=UPI0007C73730|nr:LLM class flavin-dependent oxidoreductase [Actinoplanes rectilineatus]